VVESLPSETVTTTPPVSTRVRRGLRRGVRGAKRAVSYAAKHLARFGERGVHLTDHRTRSLRRDVARSALVGAATVIAVRQAAATAARLFNYTRPDELHACPGCSSSALKLLAPLPLNNQARGHRYGFITGCRACGLVFANPIPNVEALRAFYSPSGEWGRERKDADDRKPATAYLLGLFEHVREWVDVTRPPDGGRVLDVGSGGGELLDFFAALGWQTFGIDPGDKRAFPRHQELPDVPTEPTFDIAVLHHVLEHVRQPLVVLRDVHRALKPGGVLFVSVPRLDTLPLHRDLRYCVNPRTHIVCFTADALRTLLARAGFEPRELDSPHDVDPSDWYTVRRLRMMARKVERPPAPPPSPLAAAEAAFESYERAVGARRWTRWLPARTRAALADWQRRPAR
jgi:SAM-dependent methyltransferase